MKNLMILILASFSIFASAEAVNKLEYKVVSSTCATSAGSEEPCAFQYTKLRFIKGTGGDPLQLEQEMENGSVDIYFLGNENSKDNREALVYDEGFKRLVYNNSSEIFSDNPDYIIETINLHIQLYQLNEKEAVYIETFNQITAEGTVNFATFTAKLEKQ